MLLCFPHSLVNEQNTHPLQRFWNTKAETQIQKTQIRSEWIVAFSKTRAQKYIIYYLFQIVIACASARMETVTHSDNGSFQIRQQSSLHIPGAVSSDTLSHHLSSRLRGGLVLLLPCLFLWKAPWRRQKLQGTKTDALRRLLEPAHPPRGAGHHPED